MVFAEEGSAGGGDGRVDARRGRSGSRFTRHMRPVRGRPHQVGQRSQLFQRWSAARKWRERRSQRPLHQRDRFRTRTVGSGALSDPNVGGISVFNGTIRNYRTAVSVIRGRQSSPAPTRSPLSPIRMAMGTATPTSLRARPGRNGCCRPPAKPARPLSQESLTCDATGHASLFGQAAVDDGSTVAYRLDLADIDRPRRRDAFRLRLGSGYDSGEVLLRAGRVELKTR
jgi:hypothetical protein